MIKNVLLVGAGFALGYAKAMYSKPDVHSVLVEAHNILLSEEMQDNPDIQDVLPQISSLIKALIQIKKTGYHHSTLNVESDNPLSQIPHVHTNPPNTTTEGESNG